MKSIRKVIFLVLLTAALFFYGAAPAHANWLADLIGSALIAVGAITTYPLMLLAIVIGYIMAVASTLFLSLSGLLVGAANHLQSFDNIFSEQNVIVSLGWTIVRDVANLGFVLAIILMAFATVLRLEQYRAQKTLPKLIAAAILVNFSLEIGKVIINFAQVLTDFFLSKIAVAPWALGSTLLAAFGPQRFVEGLNFSSYADVITVFNSAVIAIIVTPFFITMFNVIMSFVMLILAFMLLIRFLYLSFLLIVSPIIWLFWVVPGLAGQFNKWWNKFLEWVFFAPIMAFFLYLTYATAQGLGELTKRDSSVDNVLSGIASTLSNVFFAGIEVILLGGMMIAGLIMAQHMGIAGAKGAMSIAKKTGTGIRKGMGGYLTKTAPGKLAQFGENWPKGARWLGGGARLVGKGIQAFQKGAGRVRERLGITPAQLEKPTTLLGHIYKNIKGEFVKKKKKKLTPEEIAAGEVEFPEEEEGGGEGGKSRPTPPPAPPPKPSPLIVKGTEEEFRRARGKGRPQI